ncbi:MAG: D-Ala-D-Ala carboxypeptidase family metallohydrolase [Akkermansiaceae bacterium]
MIQPSDSEQDQIILSPVTESFTSRRKVIGTIGLASTAFCASTLQSSAWFWKKNDDIPVVKVNSSGRTVRASNTVGELPDEWVRLQGRNLKGYSSYIKSLRLKNISTHTVIAAHAKQRGSVWNSLPPKNWWKRMGYTLKVVDRVSATMGVPVKEIVSAYRSPQYNARCAGAKRKSWHQANVAVDVKFHTSPRTATATARSLRDRGLFKGGIGSYSSFTHIDTRGVNVNW